MANRLATCSLGRSDESNEQVMRQMAEQTGGTLPPAAIGQTLYEHVRGLSITSDDGIDRPPSATPETKPGGRSSPHARVRNSNWLSWSLP